MHSWLLGVTESILLVAVVRESNREGCEVHGPTSIKQHYFLFIWYLFILLLCMGVLSVSLSVYKVWEEHCFQSVLIGNF